MPVLRKSDAVMSTGGSAVAAAGGIAGVVVQSRETLLSSRASVVVEGSQAVLFRRYAQGGRISLRTFAVLLRDLRLLDTRCGTANAIARTFQRCAGDGAVARVTACARTDCRY
jgi:hypothetical protein